MNAGQNGGNITSTLCSDYVFKFLVIRARKGNFNDESFIILPQEELRSEKIAAKDGANASITAAMPSS